LGLLFVHGGFVSTRHYSETIGSVTVLDLAPGLQRNFRWFPVDQEVESYPATTDQDALDWRRLREESAILQHMMDQLVSG
jgi:hypothetical protein